MINITTKHYKNPLLSFIQLKPEYKCPSVILDLYKLIAQIANQLGVELVRQCYRATVWTTVETITIDDDENDISRTILVSKPWTTTGKTIRLDVLDKMFQNAMEHFNISIP